MSQRVREVLKLALVIAVTFALGMTLAQAFDLPRPGAAQQGEVGAPAAQVPVRPAVQRGGGAALALPSFADVVERVTPAVVSIETGRRETARAPRGVPPEFQDFFRPFRNQPRYQTGSGSGFIVSQDGYIITNNHVVAGAERVTVRLLDNRTFQARVVGRDPNTDVAVIKIDETRLPTVPFGDSDQLRIGDWVLAVGNPLGFAFTVTAGIVSAKGRNLVGLYDPDEAPLQIQDFIQTDAAINPGNSGGPLLDVEGRVVGVNSAIASQTGYYSGYGFAIPINLARRVMTDLIAHGRVQRAVLGINIAEVTPEDASFVGLERISGVMVSRFPDGRSPAREAGLQLGDVIVAVNDTAVEHVAQLQQRVGFRRPGEVVRVTVVRNENGRRGVRRSFNVRLVAAEPDQVSRAETDGADAQPEETAGRIGIRVEPMTTQFAQRNRIPEEFQGLLVTEVEPGGPAWRRLAGADEQGGPDVILFVNQTRVRTPEEFQRALRQVPRGEVVQLRTVALGLDNPQPRVVTIRSR